MSTKSSSPKKSLSLNRIPLLYSICFCFIVGIVAQLFFEENWIIYLIPILIIILSNILTNTRITTALLIIPFYFLGILNTYLHQPKLNLETINLTKEKSLSLVIIKPPQTTQKGYTKLTCTIDNIEEETNLINRDIIIYIRECSNSYTINDQIIASFKLNTIPPPSNPDEFNIKQYYRFHNIYFQTFLKTDAQIDLYQNHTFSLRKEAHKTQTTLAHYLDKYIPKTTERNILKALLLGERDELNKTTIANFSASGAMHVLAVSGLHVGIFMLLISLPFKLLKREHTLIHISITVLAIWTYAFVTGLSPSVIRASTMFSFLLIGKLFNKSSTSYTPLFLSAFVMLLFNPLYITEVGFQLSYAAVFGILYITPKLEDCIPYKPKNWLIKNTLQISYVSIAAQLATAPLSILYFHQFPTYFLVSNLIVIPIAFILVMGGLLLFLSIPISTSITVLIGYVLTTITSFLIDLTTFISTLPYNTISELNITILECYLIIILSIVSINCFVKKSYQSLPLLTISIIVISFLSLNENFVLKHSKGITIYNIPKHSAISLYNSTNNTFLGDSSLLVNKDKMQFHVQNHWFRNNFKTKTKAFSKDSFYTCSINNTSICVTNTKNSSIPDSIDYLIVSNNSLTPDEAKLKFKFRNLIYDSSNSKDFLNCIKHSPRLDYKTYIVPIEGAITLNF